MGFLILNHDADGFRQEIYIRDLNLEFTNLNLAESVTSAQATTANWYNDWQETQETKSVEIKWAEITPQNRLTSFLSSTRTQEKKLRSQIYQKRSQRDKQERDEGRALQRYYSQGEPRNSDY